MTNSDVALKLTVSHAHYPDFKGGGEKLFLVAKIFAAALFAGII